VCDGHALGHGVRTLSRTPYSQANPSKAIISREKPGGHSIPQSTNECDNVSTNVKWRKAVLQPKLDDRVGEQQTEQRTEQRAKQQTEQQTEQQTKQHTKQQTQQQTKQQTEQHAI